MVVQRMSTIELKLQCWSGLSNKCTEREHWKTSVDSSNHSSDQTPPQRPLFQKQKDKTFIRLWEIGWFSRGNNHVQRFSSEPRLQALFSRSCVKASETMLHPLYRLNLQGLTWRTSIHEAPFDPRWTTAMCDFCLHTGGQLWKEKPHSWQVSGITLRSAGIPHETLARAAGKVSSVRPSANTCSSADAHFNKLHG